MLIEAEAKYALKLLNCALGNADYNERIIKFYYTKVLD